MRVNKLQRVWVRLFLLIFVLFFSVCMRFCALSCLPSFLVLFCVVLRCSVVVRRGWSMSVMMLMMVIIRDEDALQLQGILEL
jgi:hypothetical protein